jgi:hypothetical protein
MDVVTARPSDTDTQDWSEAHIPNSEGLIVVLRPTWDKELAKIDASITQELGAAFRANIPVIPVLLNDVEMPRAEDCPPGLEHFAALNPIRIKTGNSFGADIECLVSALLETVKGLQSTGRKMRTPSPVPSPPVSRDDKSDAFDGLEAEDRRALGQISVEPAPAEDNDKLVSDLFEMVQGLQSPAAKIRTSLQVSAPPVPEDDNGDASDELNPEDRRTSYHAALEPIALEDNDQSDTQQKDELSILEEFLKQSTRSASQSS